ncbi:hypothetical protein ACQKPT_15680 [Pseudomonas monteilii]|uniref:hypothetical protein n=1 Tax=Pseudomonas monteilii TaxID=76759 RepID=UPI003D0083E0
MPKLRGIDTRGKSKTECLDKIRNQLVNGIGGRHFNLTADFDIAFELGYGQFITQSAKYLNADSPPVQVQVAPSGLDLEDLGRTAVTVQYRPDGSGRAPQGLEAEVPGETNYAGR